MKPCEMMCGQSQLAGNVPTTLANIPYKFLLCLKKTNKKKCLYLMLREHFKDFKDFKEALCFQSSACL